MLDANLKTGAFSSAYWQDFPPHRRVFTNRNLRLESIQAIGFDMDHTLAVYNTENFDRLCFEMAIERLIAIKGFPEAIRAVEWRPAAAIRGLIVDKKLGNLLKVDAYNHVTRARHGLEFLDKQERRRLYPSTGVRMTPKRYRVFDTLFDLPEGSLYTALVELRKDPAARLKMGHRRLFEDIRETMDTIHADGSLKARITGDLDRFFLRDPDLVPTLEKFRAAGKRLFLLTNSEAAYTADVMNHLVGGRSGAWEELFDLVICSAGKPDYFLEQGAGRPLARGALKNMPNRRAICFEGGDSFFLEKTIDAGGDAILYFGDHTYGDILRSKLSVGWRTAMIVPEVEQEVSALFPLQEQVRRLHALEDLLEDLVMLQDHQYTLPADRKTGQADLDKMVAQALGQRARLQKVIKGALNPHWESLFREGRAASRFGRQIMEFACIYTSRASNFLVYPPDKFFARPVEILPHERWALPEGEA